MRSVPEPSSVGGGTGSGRDPWAGFGAGPASGSRYPSAGTNGAGEAGDERATADLARRLQDRVDGQEALLDRIADLLYRPDDRARMAELRDVSRRLRRDSEALLLLCGADPGVHRGTPHTVAAVLGDAVALTDEPSRVAVAPPPPVTLAASAAVELRHLVAELVDEAVAGSPGARIEVAGRLEADGALVVDVVVAGRGWTDALGGARRSAFGDPPRVAERLAARSTGGIRLDRPLIDRGEGVVATLRCPAALVTGHTAVDPWQLSSGSVSSGSLPSGSLPSGSLSSGSLSSGSLSSGSLPSGSLPASRSMSPLSSPGLSPSGPAAHRGPGASSDTYLLDAPRSGRGDELFGPLPTAVGAVSTPIFEEVASAWFRDDERGPAVDDWNSPGDREWRAAAARATRTDVPTTTSSGLPRRSPGDRLVPPPRAARAEPAPDEQRVPERVRDRLSTYQRGLRQGRHRAADPASNDPSEAWTADGW